MLIYLMIGPTITTGEDQEDDNARIASFGLPPGVLQLFCSSTTKFPSAKTLVTNL